MINKKNLLGKEPYDLGDKDAIHVAIVAVRAGLPIRPGQRCKLNEYGEAVPGDGPGVADPFLMKTILCGQSFWLLMGQAEIPNVVHVWEHPDIKFDKPTREAIRNKYIERYAEQYGVTYLQLMEACAHVVATKTPALYPKTGTKMAKECEDIETYDIWQEWADENIHEFPNNGTQCCPEWEYPKGPIFKWNE